MLLFLSGCASSTKYAWGNYEDALFQHYKTPVELGTYQAALEAVIKNAERQQGKVPPGVYAEYGYLLMINRRANDAVRYYMLERDTWVESEAFMNKMIAVARGESRDDAGTFAVPVPATTEPLEKEVIKEEIAEPAPDQQKGQP